ncbi:MAG: bifunctional glutamate N-acetyltransferase/amino-acid acetyltransferase ArgJ [Propionibacteriaceae bacterium]|nr:bifunctional glutamate N-acetyltransferase/amino-acid acetyltransferase ArgJ [Propionibacteriaceae bacterium]
MDAHPVGGGQGVTFPLGFRAAGVPAGQKSTGAPDLALVVNDGPQITAAAVFTPNRFAAAPVQWSKAVMASGVTPRVVVLNSGGANACTGAPGFEDSKTTAQRVASVLRTRANEVLVASTGLIGKPLVMPPLLAGVDAAAAALSTDGGPQAAEAIITTDTHSKTTQGEVNGWRVGGMVKGAGMIAPALATLLVVVTTDALVDNETAQRALTAAADLSFNRIDVDGCMSTNDTLILLASGASGIRPSEEELTVALAKACYDLSLQVIGDAEGASHDIEITVAGAVTEQAALEAARVIGRNNLFKCAIFGNDPNWGRAVAALGTLSEAQCPYDATQVDVSFNGVKVCIGGGVGEPRELVNLGQDRRVKIVVDLHAGSEAATIYTNDLTYAYVEENAEYPT